MSTTSLGFRYPSSLDPIRPYEHIQNLATDVNGSLLGRNPIQADAGLSANYTFTGSMTDLPGCLISINMPTAGLAAYMVSWSGDVQLMTAGNVTGSIHLMVDGVQVGRPAVWNPGNVAAGARNSPASSATGVLVGTGTHTFKLQALGAISSGVLRLNAVNTGLSVLVLPY